MADELKKANKNAGARLARARLQLCRKVCKLKGL
jgi:hypothetical protein